MNEPWCGNTEEGSLQAPTTTNYDERSSTSQTEVDASFVSRDSHNQLNQRHKGMTSFRMVSSSRCLEGEAARLTALRKVLLARSLKRTKIASKSLQCTGCGKTFNQKKILLIHRRRHTGDTPHKCDACGKSFLLKYALNKHYRDQGKPSADTNRSESHCSAFFSNKKRSQSLDRSTWKSRPCGQTVKKSYGCTVCNKVFTKIYPLRQHMRIHSSEKRYECNICKKRIKYKPNLDRHMRNHTINETFQCEKCNKLFSQKEHLLVYLKKPHVEGKPFQCKMCKKEFKTKSEVDAHMRRHSGERPFKCNICKKGSKTKADLSRHMKIHTGYKPFKCQACSKSFSGRGL